MVLAVSVFGLLGGAASIYALWAKPSAPVPPRQVLQVTSPVQNAQSEKFQYADFDRANRLRHTAFLAEVLGAVWTIPLPPSWDQGTTRVPSRVGAKDDIEAFVEIRQKEAREVDVVLFRNRSAAGLERGSFSLGGELDSFGELDVSYRPICDGREAPLVVANSAIGSGLFLEMRVVAWDAAANRFVDLLWQPDESDVEKATEMKFRRPVPGRSNGLLSDLRMWWRRRQLEKSTDEAPGASFGHGYFAFADLDGDGCKELIVTRGWKAIDQRTQIFALRGDRFIEIEKGSAIHKKFEQVAEDVKDKTIWTGPREGELGR